MTKDGIVKNVRKTKQKEAQDENRIKDKNNKKQHQDKIQSGANSQSTM